MKTSQVLAAIAQIAHALTWKKEGEIAGNFKTKRRSAPQTPLMAVVNTTRKNRHQKRVKSDQEAAEVLGLSPQQREHFDNATRGTGTGFARVLRGRILKAVNL